MERADAHAWKLMPPVPVGDADRGAVRLTALRAGAERWVGAELGRPKAQAIRQRARGRPLQRGKGRLPMFGIQKGQKERQDGVVADDVEAAAETAFADCRQVIEARRKRRHPACPLGAEQLPD